MGIKDEISELLQAYDDAIFTYAYYATYSIDDAKEITGQVFQKYAELRAKGKAVADLEASLYRLARNLSIRAVRVKGVETGDPDYPVDVIEEGDYFSQPERVAELPERRQMAIEASRHLTEELRTVLILKELQGKEYDEIAVILGVESDSAIGLVSEARLSLGGALGMERIDEERAGEQCQGYLPLLSFQVDGLLKESERDLLDLHLNKCAFCRLVLEEMEKASEDYRSLIPLRSAMDADALMKQLADLEMHYGALLPTDTLGAETAVAVGTGAAKELALKASSSQLRGGERALPDNMSTIIAAIMAVCVVVVIIVLAVLRQWAAFAIVLVVGIIATGVFLYIKNEGFKVAVDQALESLMDYFNTQSKWTIRDMSTEELNGIIASIGNVMARDGYMPQSQSPGFYTYFKQTQERPSCLVALILWFFCIIPAIIYLLRGSKIRTLTASVQFIRTSVGYTLNVKAPGGAKRRIRKVIEPYLVMQSAIR